MSLASLLGELGLVDECERLLATLEAAGELHSEVLDLRARLAERSGDLSEAIELFRQSLNAGGGARSRFALAGALRDAGMIDQAIEQYNLLGTADRTHGLKVALQLARLYVDLERFDDALRALREALKLDLGTQTEAYVYAELGYVYRHQGLLDAALASYRRSAALEPGDPTATGEIVRIEALIGQTASSAEPRR